LPHVPQFCASVLVDAHVVPHAVVPPGHPHCDERHTSVAPHAMLHAPQLRGSAAVSAHVLPHVVNGAVQAPTHVPDWQSGVAPVHA
jgi:hypothetical protein